MMWEVHPDGSRWSLRRTTAGRLADALRWAVIGFGVTLVGATIFFGIDWVGRIAVGAEAPAAFVLTVVLFSVFGGFFAFVARMLRFRHWVIDREAAVLGLSLRRAFADAQVEDVPLDSLRRIAVELRGPGAVSSVVAQFEDGASEVLARTRLGKFAFDGVVLGLQRAFDDTGVDVDVTGEE